MQRASLRWVGMGLLALAEVTWLAIRIEAPATGLRSYAKGLPSIFITSLVIVLILAWARSHIMRTLPRMNDVPRPSWWTVLAQMAAFAAFSFCTISIFEHQGASSGMGALLLLAWMITGLAAGVMWLLALMPARAWIRLTRDNASIVCPGVMFVGASVAWGWFAGRAWTPLRGPTFVLVEWLLKSFGQNVVSEPSNYVLGTSQFNVGIAPACAGYEGIGLMIIFVGAYLVLLRSRLKFPLAFFLLPCAVLAIWLVNAVRMAALVLIGTYVSPTIAMGGFHAQAGWIGFIGVAMCMVVVTQHTTLFAVSESDPAWKVREINPTTAYLVPLMVLLAFTMITGALSSGFAWWSYPVRIVGTGAAIWFVWRRSITWHAMTESCSWQPMLIGFAAFVIWMALEHLINTAHTGSPIATGLADMPVSLAAFWLLFRVLGSILIIPIAEELAFRGYLLRRLISANFDQLTVVRFTWLSFLLSSGLFGALHGRWLAGTIAGMCYAFAMYRRGKVGDAIIAHATTNVLMAADVLIFGQWSLWA
jgi:exosortase E/protease (VPEID-CTERM system)